MPYEWSKGELVSCIPDEKTSTELLAKLNDFSLMLLKQDDLNDVLWSIVNYVGEVFGYNDFVLYLRIDRNMVQQAAYGVKSPSERSVLNQITIPIGKGNVGACAETLKPLRVEDTAKDKRYIFDVYNGRSELSVPIIYEGCLIGILDSESCHPCFYDELDVAIFNALAALCAPRIAAAQFKTASVSI